MKKTTALLLAAGALMAADLQVGELKQHVELGYLGTSGNSDSKTLNALYSNEYRWSDRIDTHFRTDAYYGESDGEKSDERYRAHAIGNYRIDPRWYAYAEAGALRNPFEGYNQQYNGGLGVGYVFFKDAVQLFKGKGGYQYRHSNFTDGTRDDLHYAKMRLNYDYHFSDTNTFESELNLIDNLERGSDYESVLRMGLKLLIVDRLSFRVGFEIKYDNEPPVDKKKTDTTTTAGIVYDF